MMLAGEKLSINIIMEVSDFELYRVLVCVNLEVVYGGLYRKVDLDIYQIFNYLWMISMLMKLLNEQ